MANQIANPVQPTPEYPNNTHPSNQPDEYVKCPYFPEHELRKSRLPYHLLKCQKNPRAPKLLACPFNYMHRIRPEDREDHAILCEDRVFVKYADKEQASYANTRRTVFGISESKKSTPEPNRPIVENNDNTEDGEDWW